MKIYNLITKNNDPYINLKIPAAILRDVVLRSEENGCSVEMEFARRLARTLERDNKMIFDDNQLAYKLFNTMGK